MFIAETGAENQARAPWLRYVVAETEAAMLKGIPVDGICLYPIINHPGWNDDRHCHNGLWDYADETGERPLHQPLAEQLKRAQKRFANMMALPKPLLIHGRKNRKAKTLAARKTRASRFRELGSKR
jgi:hypothetical protein